MSVAPRLNFSQLNGFPGELQQDKILTITFLESSNEIITVIEKSGMIFATVSDMQGNVEQLRIHYEKDENGRKYIEDLIVTDVEKVSHSWLLWLKRALEAFERFFHHIMSDEEVLKGKSDDLRPAISKAYDEVLKPYHGSLLQDNFTVRKKNKNFANLFNIFFFQLFNRCLVSRETLLGTGSDFENNLKHLQIQMPRLRLHIDKIDRLYLENNLVDKQKA